MSVDPPPILPVRLKREMEFKSQLGCTLFLGLLLSVLGSLIFWGGTKEKEGGWIMFVVGGVFALVGLLLLFAFVRQWAASGMPVTIVEVSEEPLQPGQVAKFCVIQGGPANLKSLSANLICIERRTSWVKNSSASGRGRQVNDKNLLTENLLDEKHLRVAAGDTWQEVRDFTLPADALESGTKDDIQILWKVEVWGVGYGLASFMHPFVVDVFRGQRPVEEEEESDDDDKEEMEA